MAARGWRGPLARFAAPAAFLAAATVAALLVRAGLNARDQPGKSSSAPATASVTTVPSSGKPLYYRVRNGDTLGAVAQRFNTTVDDLRALNPGVDPNALRIGQRLRVR